MHKELLNLRPTHFLCPYCGKWHKWQSKYPLICYNCYSITTNFHCETFESISPSIKHGNVQLHFKENCCYYRLENVCEKAHQASIWGNIALSELEESLKKPVVTFKVPFVSNSVVSTIACQGCYTCLEHCAFPRLGDKGDGIHMHIKFGFKFDEEEYKKVVPGYKSKKSNNLTHLPSDVKVTDDRIYEGGSDPR